MNHSIKVGLSFGLTSGIITTLGLMVGLSSGTHSKIAVLGGILTIAVADSMSDAFGIHVSEEAEGVHTQKEIWESTLTTFIAKLLFALTFIIPLLFFTLQTAVVVGVIWGLFALSVYSYVISKGKEISKLKVVLEHLFVGVIVIVITHFVGVLISMYFG
ncbi:hypothetical protein HOL83_00465 [Candidatus Woesearchaeota archaeon]|jgi:vacuolar iron transporter family protein|nr:hypothetical protein [Candidatus Woesearchaeota archaeon]MBT5271787.1 hypothetical protein [Candidatus Woesearchaeota archaeon]MBT6041172.1 hypothetical protein [Candidatus Woesearchaeota archaeon]MBT6336293.1 hypothetical protein [Candidatus Woesearchaeota archaeon]